MTRSSMEMAKVTPAALIACRSTGASSQGLVSSRLSAGVLARMSSSEPTRSPRRLGQRAGGVRRLAEVAHRREAAGDVDHVDEPPTARIATTDGPFTSGRQMRPARAPAAPSCGRVVEGLSARWAKVTSQDAGPPRRAASGRNHVRRRVWSDDAARLSSTARPRGCRRPCTGLPRSRRSIDAATATCLDRLTC